MLDLLNNNKSMVAQLVGLLFAILAAFHVVLPTAIDQPAIVGIAALLLTAVTGVLRFGVGGNPADAKEWWQSRTIWTQIVAALFALAGILGFVPKGLDQATAIAGVMIVVALINVVLHRATSTAIASS